MTTVTFASCDIFLAVTAREINRQEVSLDYATSIPPPPPKKNPKEKTKQNKKTH